ncbi:hypothetical protein [Tenggerimyces flavus]|uniref:Uncharacterized protein n=1 Tax=Tenggerimyces flavus TaxID=1708749 RepID=A0ABV7Y5U9_9ACTN|nr:hypothetical protein [Tenggerimyces flavus]MBM7788257.1 uncharacterized protein YggT (Ycf19 family) [Tenggerimyces flavus]
MLRRIAPAVGLFFLSPLVAEFLLGNLSVTMLVGLVVLSLLYGGGALLVREVAHRAGLRWPSIVLLALAYGVLEEGITTQTLFNPHYYGHDLLSYGHVDVLGMGIPWTVFVLTLHTVWSISVPILVVELLVGPERRTQPWLGKVGLTVTAVLFAAGVVITTAMQLASDPFRASVPQFAGVVVAIVLLVVAAFALRRMPSAPVEKPAPHPLLVVVGTLAAGAAVMELAVEESIPAWLGALALVALGARQVPREARSGGEHVAWGHDHSGGAVRTGREG